MRFANRSNAPTETLIKGTQRKKLTELNTWTLGNLIKRNHDGFPWLLAYY